MLFARLSTALLATLAITVGIMPLQSEVSQAQALRNAAAAPQRQATFQAGLQALQPARCTLAENHFRSLVRQAQCQGDDALAQRSLIPLGLAQYRQGRYLRASDSLGQVQVQSLAPGDQAEWRIYRAWIDLAQGRYRQAWQLLNRYRLGLQDSRLRSRVLAAGGDVEQLDGDYQGAIAMFQRVISLQADPIDKAQAWYGLGQVYQQLGQADKALYAYGEAKAIDHSLSHTAAGAAGVPSLGALLWPVSDESTVFLMARFYEQLAVRGDKVQALRQAMLLMREQYLEPLDWAAFTLIGQLD